MYDTLNNYVRHITALFCGTVSIMNLMCRYSPFGECDAVGISSRLLRLRSAGTPSRQLIYWQNLSRASSIRACLDPRLWSKPPAKFKAPRLLRALKPNSQAIPWTGAEILFGCTCLSSASASGVVVSSTSSILTTYISKFPSYMSAFLHFSRFW